MKAYKFILPIFLSLLFLQGKADSPLTSTYFAEHYADNKIVAYAAEKGEVDKKIAKYLLNDKKPIAIKAAVANALGWDIDGKHNATLLMGFLVKKYKWSGDEVNTAEMNASELMVLGYLMALDDYFHPAEGLKYLDIAKAKRASSLTVRMVHALVAAQIAFDSNWCDVYQLVNEVAKDSDESQDFAPAAVNIIMEYINLYKDEC